MPFKALWRIVDDYRQEWQTVTCTGIHTRDIYDL